jgi:hypothetical protein
MDDGSRNEHNQMRAFFITSILFYIYIIVILSNSLAETVQNTQSVNEKNNISQLSVGMYMIDIVKIDDAGQKITVNFIMTLSWIDKNLAGVLQPGVLTNFENIWIPAVRFVNSLNLVKDPDDYLEIDSNGKFIYKQRYYGDISINQNFADFPFNDQLIDIKFVLILPSSMNSIYGESSTGQTETFTITNWDIQKGLLQKSSGDFDLENYHYWSYQFITTRRTGYYIWKVIFPLILVVFMSWTVFWVDPVHIGPQLTVATTSMLTLIAYHFTLVDRVPNISYLTRLDGFIIIANIFIFLALIEAILTSRLASLNKIDLARKIDLISRITFPSFFVLLIIYVLFL